MTNNIVLPGLTAPVEIAIDAAGVPHIRAQSEEDLFFAQGFNAARERLFQIDLWRKRGLGLLAADFGPGFLEQDRASRLFLYRGDMGPEFAAYAPDARAIIERFVAGVNAFVAMTEADSSLLPEEFVLLGTRPARWKAEDVCRVRTHSLSRNAISEVLRCRVLAGADAATDALRKTLAPAIEPKLAEGLDPASIPLAVLDLVKLATANVTFTPERMKACLEEAPAWRGVSELLDVVQDAAWSGSNNWAVSGKRTDTGKPILASDPHRLHVVPSIRYVVHLTAPGLDVIGGVEPHSPGVTFGHNGSIAYAVTIFYIDQEDLYFYDIHPDDPELYRYAEGWERMRVVEEAFPVKGHADQLMRLKFTRHGPVVHEDRRAKRAYAVRSVAFEPGSAPYLRHLSLMRAMDWASFRRGTEGWAAPSVNFAYADTSGTVGWTPAGMNPIRPNWDGLTPVPGDGRYEWAGFRDPAAMPSLLNPPEGFVATANEMNLPKDWNHNAHPMGFEWIDFSRATRIREVLSGVVPHGMGVSRALQTDVVSTPARRLVSLLAPLVGTDRDGERALALLRDWGGSLAAVSGPAALFEVWWTHHLRAALFAALAPEVVRKLLLPGDVESILAVLEQPDGRFGQEPTAARDALLLATLADAYRDVAARLGPDEADWAWGKLHHGQFEHPIAAIAPPDRAAAWRVGPFPLGGSAVTPMHTGYRPSDFRCVMGSSFRLIVDLSDFDRSIFVNTPGQSGRPGTAHWDDLAARWAAGDYAPLPYTRAAVDAATQKIIRLEPKAER